MNYIKSKELLEQEMDEYEKRMLDFVENHNTKLDQQQIDEKENKLLNRKRGYTDKITCHPSYRNTNIARALFSESIKMFREMGMEEIAFDVDIMNEKEELSMAESFGFKAKKYYVGMNKKVELAV